MKQARNCSILRVLILEKIMPFKTVLTVTAPDLGFADIDMAASLCESVEAHLSTLIVQTASPPPIGEYAAVVSEAWLQERREEERRLEARRNDVTAHLARKPISADVATEYPEVAWANEVIGRRGLYADVTLAGPEVLAAETLRAKIIEGALFASGKPLLVVPDAGSATLVPQRMLVAWDARVEAARAVHAALDMLKRARDVKVVIVDPVTGATAHGAEPGADVATYLSRHGVRASVERVPSQGLSVADVLRRCARDFGSQMLVMGAYGHSRLRERIFGGVTRSLLEEPSLPVFLAR
jgi:nucleotide-binding universal stress UspA family protein